MTAANNEEELLEKTITSVLSQTMLPKVWVMVSDNSSDRTDEIIQSYSKRHSFIRYLRTTRAPGRDFGSKVIALQQASKTLQDISFEFIGNIDADTSVERSYFAALMACFEQNPRLGIAAGFVCEKSNGRFRSRASNRLDSVCHAAQLVRRECYEAIGGYSVLQYGGEDWYAQQCAKMKGWHVEAFAELQVFHHRLTGTAGSLVQHQFCLGRLDYSFGSDPGFEVFKCARRLLEKPVLVGAATRFGGFIWSYLCSDHRAVSDEFIDFLRKEQRSKVFGVFHHVARHRLVGCSPPDPH